jgi:hypothetical protein
MTDITPNKYRAWRAALDSVGETKTSLTAFAGHQIVVVFGARDTKNGRILTEKPARGAIK